MRISRLSYFFITIISIFYLKIFDLTITDSVTQCSNRRVNEPGEANDAIMNVPHNTPVANVITPNAVINVGANIPVLILNPEEIPVPLEANAPALVLNPGEIPVQLEANAPLLNSNPFETPPTYPSVPPIGANPPPLNLADAPNLARHTGPEPLPLPSTNSDSPDCGPSESDCGD